MRVNVNNFNGVVPKLDAQNLPDTFAQNALNCDVSGGTLRLLNGYSEGSCGASEVTHTPYKIAVPNTPVLTAYTIFDPASSVTAKLWYTTSNSRDMSYVSHTWTNYGVDILYSVTEYRIDGIAYAGFQFPKLQLTVTDPDGNSDTLPATITSTSNIVGQADQIYSDNYLLGTFQVKEVADLPEAFSIAILGYQSTRWGAAQIRVKVAMNYTVPYNQYLFYRITAEDFRDREGPPSDISAGIVREPGQYIQVNLQGLSVFGDYTPNKMHIYRAEQGTEPENFFHLDEINDSGDGAYNDMVANKSKLGRNLPVYRGTSPSTPLWGNRPNTMTKIIQMPSMFYCGYYDKTLYFSGTREKNHRFPTAFFIELDYEIVDIQNLDDTVIVITKGGCYAVYGQEPYEHVALLLTDRCCNNVYQVAKLENYVYYISPDGLIRVGNRAAQNIMKPYFDIKNWRALQPSLAILTAQGDRLYMFTGSVDIENYVFDFHSNRIDIVQTDSDTAAFESSSLNWKGRKYRFNEPVSFKFARVIADSYNSVTLKIYTNGSLSNTISVSSNEAFRLPKIEPAKYWELEIISDSTVYEISIAQNMEEFSESE